MNFIIFRLDTIFRLNNFINFPNKKIFGNVKPSICTLALRMRKFIYCVITQISARVRRLKFSIVMKLKKVQVVSTFIYFGMSQA